MKTITVSAFNNQRVDIIYLFNVIKNRKIFSAEIERIADFFLCSVVINIKNMKSGSKHVSGIVSGYSNIASMMAYWHRICLVNRRYGILCTKN